MVASRVLKEDKLIIISFFLEVFGEPPSLNGVISICNYNLHKLQKHNTKHSSNGRNIIQR